MSSNDERLANKKRVMEDNHDDTTLCNINRVPSVVCSFATLLAHHPLPGASPEKRKTQKSIIENYGIAKRVRTQASARVPSQSAAVGVVIISISERHHTHLSDVGRA